MAVARVSNTSGVGWNTAVGGGFDTSALSFTIPSGKASGVVAVVSTVAFTGNNGTPSYATPSGWTPITGAGGSVTVGTDVENHQMFYRRLDGTETTVSFTPDRACWKQGWIVLCSGALASGDPTEAAGFTAGATNTTTKAHTVGSASADGSLAIFSGGNFNNTLVATVNNSFTEFFESNNQYCATRAVNTGAVGATTMTLSSGSDAGFAAAVVIKPDAGGATNVTATGATTQAAGTLAGAATETIAGAGATTQAPGTPTGALVETILAVGATAQAAGVLAGAGTETIAGSGATIQPAGALAGTLLETIAGAGTTTQAAGILAGVGTVGADVVGQGATTQPAGSLAGALTLTYDVVLAGATTQATGVPSGVLVELIAAAGATVQGAGALAGNLDVDVFAGGASDDEVFVRRIVVVPARSLTLIVPPRPLTVEVSAP